MSELAARFMRVFEGYMDAHGTYESEQTSAQKKKVEIKATASTKRKPVTEKLWDEHLAGDSPLGVIPIRTDNTCSWGCVDVDKYENVDLPGLVQRIAKLTLPLIVARSKSGGAHLFLFTKEPVPAADMRHKLEEISAILGFGGSEIFPKQTQIAYDRGDLGNWLNMPYYGGKRTTRYGFLPNGEAASPEQFLDIIQTQLIDNLHQVTAINIKKADAEFREGPPCLELLTAEGFPEGTRNNGLFALGVFIRKKYTEDQFRDKLHEFNHQYLKPPLPVSEVDQIFKSLTKPGKHYNYKCTEHPCLSFCNRGVCVNRQYGVGAGTSSMRFGSLTILETERPAYFLDVILEDGITKRADFRSAEELTRQQVFRVRVLEVCHRVAPKMGSQSWDQFIDNLLLEATMLEPPPEFTEFGQFRELVEQFCIGRGQALAREDVLRGKVWTEEGFHWFTTAGLMDFLQKKQYKEDKKFIFDKLKKLGAEPAVQLMLKNNRNKRCWRLREFIDERIPFELPNLKEPVI